MRARFPLDAQQMAFSETEVGEARRPLAALHVELLERLARGARAAAVEWAPAAALVGELPFGELAQRRDRALVAQLAERARRADPRIARLASGHAHQLLQAAALAALGCLRVAVRCRTEGAARFLDARVGEDPLLALFDLLELLAGGAEVVLREGALDRIGAPGRESYRRAQHEHQSGGDRHAGIARDAREPCRRCGGHCAPLPGEAIRPPARPGRARS